jgi:type VI secretion-associated protein, impA family
MNMNFYDIMKDISPESIANLEVLIGKPDEDTANS